jgi:AraC-like DNA-binding protein/mannose-6-phosphate isomerase-like protein (cupin superfamily)
LYALDVSLVIRFESTALGRPYHVGRHYLGPRSQESEVHGHADFHELMCVVSGRGEHLLETRSVPLEHGDAVLVRPRDRHAISGLAPHGVAFINVAFPSSLWHSFADLARIDPAGEWNTSREPPVLRASPGQNDAVVAVFEAALRQFHIAPTLFDLLRFWIDLLSLVVPATAGVVPAVPTRPGWLVTACAAMRREDNMRTGVRGLLELAGVSPAHLSRSMREHYGTTPTAFVNDLRLEHAAALLATTNQPLALIAARCGFASQSYFSRCFSAAHGISPREFRRNAQRAFVP